MEAHGNSGETLHATWPTIMAFSKDNSTVDELEREMVRVWCIMETTRRARVAQESRARTNSKHVQRDPSFLEMLLDEDKREELFDANGPTVEGFDFLEPYFGKLFAQVLETGWNAEVVKYPLLDALEPRKAMEELEKDIAKTQPTFTQAATMIIKSTSAFRRHCGLISAEECHAFQERQRSGSALQAEGDLGTLLRENRRLVEQVAKGKAASGG